MVGKDNWEGNLGNEIGGLLARDCEYLPQREPLYSLVNLSPGAFSDMFKLHRNIVIFNIDSTVVKLTPKENKISDDDFKIYSNFTKALFQHRNKKIKNALIDSRHIISNIDKKILKKKLNAIEDDELNEYLSKRVVELTPEEILFLSKKLNPIFNE